MVHTCSSSRRLPDPLVAGLLRSRFPPRLLTGMTLRRFGISACTANPEGLPPSPAQHGSCWRSSTSSSRSFQDTPRPHVPVGDAFTRVIAISRAVVADRSQYWSGSDLRKATGSDDRQTVTSSKFAAISHLHRRPVTPNPSTDPTPRVASRLRAPRLSIAESGDGYQADIYPTFYPTTRDPVPSGCFHH